MRLRRLVRLKSESSYKEYEMKHYSKNTVFLQVIQFIIYCALGNFVGNHAAETNEEGNSLRGNRCDEKCRPLLRNDRIKCLFRCGIHKGEKFGRLIRRSTNNTRAPSSTRMEGNVCYNRYSHKDPNGIKNPNAKVRQITYRLDKNKTIAQITWDPPAECVERQDVCKGYFVLWGLDFGGEKAYCQIVSKNITEFILNEANGFNGRNGFAVNVKAIPYQSRDSTPLNYMTPPSPEKLPLTVIFTTPKPMQTTFPITTTRSQAQTFLPDLQSTVSSKPAKGGQTKDKTEITLIFSLSVFAVVIIAALGIVIKWCWPKPKPDLLPIPRKTTKGIIYVSYLPEKSTINQVNGIYSWLKFHNIDVVMDQMYDHKLYNSLGPKRFGEKFLAQAEKVIMIVTQGYLKLCWLDETVDIDSKPLFNSLNEERLYSEVSDIKDELSTTLKHGSTRFIALLVNVPDDYLPKWLQKLTSVKWPEDGKTKTFLNLLKGDDLSVGTKYEGFSFV